MFDSRLTTSGEKYSDLPETYIIFITANDVLGDGLPVYNIERTIQETGKLFHDRAHIVYVNGAYRGTDEVGALMQDFRCDDYRDIRNPKIRARVKYFKENNKLIEAQRIEERVNYDMEMLSETGFCRGIENYSRHIALKEEGCLLYTSPSPRD